VRATIKDLNTVLAAVVVSGASLASQTEAQQVLIHGLPPRRMGRPLIRCRPV